MHDIRRNGNKVIDLRGVTDRKDAPGSNRANPSRFRRFLGTFVRSVLSILIGSTVVAGIVYAGSITAPGGAPAAQSYTLSDIYAQIKDGTAATLGNHSLSPTTTPQSSFHSLSAIYDAAVALRASSVSLANMFNGTCNNTGAQATCPLGTEYPGGSQANGGVEDFNADSDWVGQTPPANRYETTWTTCNAGNSYCGTGDAGANAKDEATGVVWSYPCKDSGCSAWDTSAPVLDPCRTGAPDSSTCYWNTDTYYTWDNSGANNNSLTAAELCSSHSGWSLPHQKQLMQAYVDGSYGNLEPIGAGRFYWSLTTRSDNPTNAWYVGLSDGSTNYDNKANQYSNVRCVRLAI